MAKHDSGTANITYYRPTAGQFMYGDKNDPQFTRGLSGRLSRITIKDDPGDKARNIAPGHKVNVSLEDEGNIEVISFKAESTFGWMIAQSLSAVQKGAEILVETSHGDNEKICFAWVKTFENGVKGDIARPDYPKDRDEKIAKGLADLLAHPALYTGEDAATTADDEYDPFADEAA